MKFRTVFRGQVLAEAAVAPLGGKKATELGKLWDAAFEPKKAANAACSKRAGFEQLALSTGVRNIPDGARNGISANVMGIMKRRVIVPVILADVLAGFSGYSFALGGISSWQAIASGTAALCLLAVIAYNVFLDYNTKRHLDRLSE